jgi:hypothetical protein
MNCKNLTIKCLNTNTCIEVSELNSDTIYTNIKPKDYITGTFDLEVDIDGFPSVLENIKAKIYRDGRLEGDYEGYKISGTFDPSQTKWL